ncbi:MAG: multicopper oxidase domain-containing protein [Tannerella sp.]|jgi:FtsP/CotA-like multicopper oxidase with cupredoxin domain|nr:multicopper oxidase domain-containing protein [Tannerella sp.]
MRNFIGFYIFILLFSTFGVFAQQTITYDLYVTDTMANFAGKSKMAIAINGTIPGPVLHFTEGDTAVVRVHNRMKEETSIHWHGILLPVEQDGVPYLTTSPIKPNTIHTYKFPVIQHGTYWYHSHSGLQEQLGMYGALVICKRGDDPNLLPEDNLPEHTVVLSDWTNEHPMEVNRKLHIGSDWYSIRKGAVQSYYEAIRTGHFGTKVKNEWKRMHAMDVSDIYYDRFLVNGLPEEPVSPFDPDNTKVRLRIINAGSSTYFWIQYAGGKITVIGNDGLDVEPVKVDRLLVAVAETYDIVIDVPDDKMSYELLATAEDRSGSTSLWFGEGHKMHVQPMPKLRYFEGMKMMNSMMKMNGDMDDMGMDMSMQKMDMNAVMYPESTDKNKSSHNHSGHSMDMGHDGGMHGRHTMDSGDIATLNYSMLKSRIKTNLPQNVPTRELRFELTGNMDRYVWTLDNKTLSESDKILIKKGENLRIILYNNSMMRHPMHLHGHFFRTLNGQGDYAPLKHTLDIMPMETDTIEFTAMEQGGDWFFHCHILYHMMSGMGRIFSYEDSPPNPQVPDPEKSIRHLYHDDRMFYFTVQNDFAFNGNNGRLEYSNTRWSVQGEWSAGYNDKHGYEAEGRFGRYIGKMQWLFPYAGVAWNYQKGAADEENLFGQSFKKDNRIAGVLGVRYTLPLLLVADARVDTYGRFRIQLEREDIPISSQLRMTLMANTDGEYRFGLRYLILPYLGISGNYDRDMKWGAGVTLIY